MDQFFLWIPLTSVVYLSNIIPCPTLILILFLDLNLYPIIFPFPSPPLLEICKIARWGPGSLSKIRHLGQNSWKKFTGILLEDSLWSKSSFRLRNLQIYDKSIEYTLENLSELIYLIIIIIVFCLI